MRLRLAGLAAALVALGALASPAIGGYYGDPPAAQPQPQPQQSSATIEVEAAGNPFTGGLAFKPKDVRARVGQIVRWTNTDAAVPHTATEDHQLWDLSGDYGAGPFPRGFGPGESRQRAFEAGTHHYLCKVHAADMKGTVAVPVTLTIGRKKVGRPGHRHTVRVVVAKWAPNAPPRPLVFDVQRRQGSGSWRTLAGRTRHSRVSFRSGKSGTRWQVRARYRDANTVKRSTAWSPVASITS
jgi:plastocyanin